MLARGRRARTSGSCSSGREDNFWQSGPTGPVRPVLRALLDRGPDFGRDDDRPGDDTERFLEFWNLVFMQYELHADGSLHAAAGAEHRHRPGPRPDGGDPPGRAVGVRDRALPAADRARRGAVRPQLRRGRLAATRALRILADHGRGMTFLLADGVVPSNEDRGYVLRRIMRRAIQQGRVLGIERAVPRRSSRARDRA